MLVHVEVNAGQPGLGLPQLRPAAELPAIGDRLVKMHRYNVYAESFQRPVGGPYDKVPRVVNGPLQ